MPKNHPPTAKPSKPAGEIAEKKDPLPGNEEPAWGSGQFRLVGGGKDASLPFWCIISADLDDLGLTKAQFRIVAHIARRCGRDGVCFSTVEEIGRVTRTHPVYVRWVVRHLVHRGLVVRTLRPGHTNYLELSDKAAWIAAGGKPQRGPVEEDTSEAGTKVLWERLWDLVPGAQRLRYQKRMKADPRKFERVLDELENRIKRGQSAGPDRLEPVQSNEAMMEVIWREFA
jgi:DNA-binding MarR family transcriptional regulator